ncbi:sensor domain-containing protein [Mycobacterium sp. M1]|uniref:Sensor domain-containing protein n=1 Tax=Mycolicibacter acidiphilus TaxID=2835306 RepID=A0ABS5RSS6_9MYCO|nr:sensor domain-containing protein [Mycolicibacter acidiphilus]MBS9536014.1 sensor domain-containing protein [Mycolicibacter acidiphilus]
MGAGASVQQADGVSGPDKRQIVIAAVIVAVVLAVVALLYFTMRPRLVGDDKLAALFLDSNQVSAVMDAPMTLGDVGTGGLTTAGALSRAGCLSALTAAQELSYTDSGHTGLRWIEARDSTEHVQHYVVQAAAAFPSAERAAAFVANAAAQWRLCADQTVLTVGPDQASLKWRLAGVVGVPPAISILETREDVKWTCQRALRASANVVVDVTACADHITDQGRKIGDEVAAKL